MLDTHPWISFRIQLSDIPIPTWILVGECVSKIHHIVGTPLLPRFAAQMHKAFVSKGIHGTAAIEGNTLREEEVSRRLEKSLELPASQEYLGKEIDNLDSAYVVLSEVIDSDSKPEIDESRIREYNRLILEGLEVEEDVIPGEYAQKQHGVANYRAPSPRDIRRLMPQLVDWLNDDDMWIAPTGIPSLGVTIVKAVVAHLYLAWIHPFGDGNGRTSRMLEAEILARGGVPAVSYHLLSDHYNKTRSVYYRTLTRTSSVASGDPSSFLSYAIQGFAEGLREQISMIKSQHQEIVWRDFVHDCFRGLDSARFNRLRRLAMDLAMSDKPVPKRDLWSVSTRVKNSYAGKTQKTVTRDVNQLRSMSLIRWNKGGYVANIGILKAFVPRMREGTDIFDQLSA